MRTGGAVVRTWSTRDAPSAHQFSCWRELICEAFLDLTPESDLRDTFAATVVQNGFGALSLARIDSQRQRVRRTARDIARGSRAGTSCTRLPASGWKPTRRPRASRPLRR
jgi:AraC family transcriptional regulator, positive regulator of tynA and feaB